MKFNCNKNILLICNTNSKQITIIRNYSKKAPLSDEIIYNIKNNKINQSKNSSTSPSSSSPSPKQNEDFIIKGNFTTEDRIKLLSMYKKNKILLKKKQENNFEKKQSVLIKNKEFNFNDPIYKESFDNFKKFQKDKQSQLEEKEEKVDIGNNNEEKEFKNYYLNDRFNFKLIKPMKYDLVVYFGESSVAKIGLINDIKEEEECYQLNTFSIEPELLMEKQIYMVIPISHLRRNCKEYIMEFLESYLELIDEFGVSISELHKIKINLFKENYQFLINSIEPCKDIPEKRESVGEIVINHFDGLNKNPYKALVEIFDILIKLILKKSAQFKLLSNQLYKEFTDKSKLNCCGRDGQLWINQQNRYESFEIKQLINSSQIRRIGSGDVDKWSKLYLFDAAQYYLFMNMFQMYDKFEMDQSSFWCYTKEYLDQYQKEIDYLLSKDNEQAKKIFLKYCLTFLKDIGDTVWKPNLILLHDDKIANYDQLPPKTKEQYSKAFQIYKKLLKRSWASFNEKENTITIKKEILSHIKVDNVGQLRYLLVKLGEIQPWETNMEILEKLNGNKLISLPDSKVRDMIEKDRNNKSISSLLKITDQDRQMVTTKSFTIDSIKTKDVDDSIGLIREDNGDHSIIVHISDVTDHVKPFSELYEWAKFRASSIYLPDSTHFMLPNQLSLDCSLEPLKENKCLSFKFTINQNGEIINYKIFPSIVKNIIKTNYQKVDNTLKYYNGNDDKIDINENEIHSIEDFKDLDILYSLSNLLKKNRTIKGIPMINLPKSKIEFDDSSKEYHFVNEKDDDQENTISNQLVSEIMIATNWISSKFSIDNNLPIPFRVQNEPDFNANIEHLSKLHPIAGSNVLLKQFKKGGLSVDNIGHYSLGLSSYCWSTSPIRRFTDIIVHSQIKNFILTKEPLYSREYLSNILPYIEKQLNSIKTFQRKTEKEILYRLLRSQNVNKLYRAIKMSMVTFGKRTYIRFLLLDHGLYSVIVDIDDYKGQLDDKIYTLETVFDLKKNFKFILVQSNEHQHIQQIQK